MTQNRKRSRNHHEDEVEFMPLSKRINNLHINNSLLFDTTPAPEWPTAANFPQNPESPHSVQSVDWAPQYTPDLNEHQNPHYFNINKLLFEMYVERLQRGGNQV